MTTRLCRHAASLFAGALFLTAASAHAARAQESSEGSYELGLWKRLSATEMLYVPIVLTRAEEVDHAEGLTGASYVRDLDSTLSLRAGYRYSWELTHTPGTEPYREHRGVAELNARPSWGARLALLNRTRFELRLIDTDASWRLRDRLLAGRKFALLREMTLTPYGTFEASFDSRYRTVNRLRLSAGAATRFTPHIMLDTYVARQRDSRGDVPRVLALGMTLNLTY